MFPLETPKVSDSIVSGLHDWIAAIRSGHIDHVFRHDTPVASESRPTSC
jgi:hypothetical protein